MTKSEYDLKVGVPCSGIDMKSDVPCTREDEAVAFACGAELAGKTALVFMQNSGLGTCLDALTSLYFPYGFNFKIWIKDRNEPEHHELMGRISKRVYKTVKDIVNHETNRSDL
jgi:sulfopyruvate decarboxylase TPP-binding subunit